jgi:DNA-binding transcriptional MerR regulator
MTETAIQGTLFGDSLPEMSAELGYGTDTVVKATGLTARQIQYWSKQDIWGPTLQPATGSGSKRLFSFKDIVILQLFQRMRDTGISLQKIRKAKTILESRGVSDLSSVTLCSDGDTVFQVRDNNDIIDLLQYGQGVFAVSVSPIWSEVETRLREFPAEKKEEEREVIPAILKFREERLAYYGS